MAQRAIMSRSVASLLDLYKSERLVLAPEFQRNSIWPSAAKAYLIDTILNDKPIPIFFLAKGRSAQTGQPLYSVVDGQQRLRAIIDFAEGRFRLTQSADPSLRGLSYTDLSEKRRRSILDYALVVQELTDYSDEDIRDIFTRINKYVVKLSPQELRNAKGSGRFHQFVTKVGGWRFWRDHRVFSAHQAARMRPAEFAAEAIILLVEGPQDKKSIIDIYYAKYKRSVPFERQATKLLHVYLKWLERVLPNLGDTRFRKPVDLYALLGAIDRVSKGGEKLRFIRPQRVQRELLEFDTELESSVKSSRAETYLAAASRQTDNIGPRSARIAILAALLEVAK